MRTIVIYVSGHGFGHASRNIEVINTLFARSSDVRVVVRTSAAKWLFDRTVRPPASCRAGATRFERYETETDTGAVQIDSLHLDEAQTVNCARAFMQDFAPRVAAEAAALRDMEASLVVSDIPALGIAAAKRARLPAVAFGNFTWDWIYADYAGAADVSQALGEVYATTDLALRLPLHGGFETIRHIVDIPLVTRRSSRQRNDIRRALCLPQDKRLVLVSFGGYGLQRVDQQALATLDGYAVIGSAQHPLDEGAMYAAGLRYEDLVCAMDVIVSKPGYGIISECIAHGTALLYTSRGHFREYDVLTREMPQYLRARFIGHDQLFAGRWQEALDALLAQPAPTGRLALNGADVAAERLLDMC